MAVNFENFVEESESVCKEILRKKSYYTDKEWMKNHVIFRLIAKEGSENFLENTPHIVIADLLVVFYLLLEQKEDYIASTRISYSLLEYMDLQENQLFALAEHNCRCYFPMYFAPITETICHFHGNIEDRFVFHGGYADELQRQKQFLCSVIRKEDDTPFFVLTNAQGINGAACLLYGAVLPQLAQIFDSDFYVVPSSIHEVLILPCDTLGSVDLNQMVQEVNKSMLKKTEVLSAHIYRYDKDLGKLVAN